MSGFLERLRGEKAAHDARIAQEDAASRARFNADSITHREQLQLRRAALNNSLAPLLATELYDAISHHPFTAINGIDGDDTTIQIQTGREWEGRLRGKHKWVDKGFEIHGRADGSLIIGDTVIKPGDTRNPQAIEEALERAYRSPKEILFLPATLEPE